MISPQNRDDFSIGAELSESHIVGLSWSPPGLAKHRRCMLAVLTSNLILSFYQSIGQGKWVRVAIVNDSLKQHFSKDFPQTEMRTGIGLRKRNIRSFTWCPALKIPDLGQQQSNDNDNDSCGIPNPRSRWGIQLLTVTNDCNDVIVLEAQTAQTGRLDESGYCSIRILSTYLPPSDQDEKYPSAQSNSIFASAMESRAKLLSIASGPWSVNTASTENIYRATVSLAAIYGTRLELLKLDATVTRGDQSQYELDTTITEHSISLSGRFMGPLQWLYTVSFKKRHYPHDR